MRRDSERSLKRRSLLGILGAAAATACLALGLAACSQASTGAAGSAAGSVAAEADGAAVETVSFTDSAGREVEVPATIDRIVPSGHTANQVLLTIAPEKMVGLSQEMTEAQVKYLGDRVADDLPILGAAFGSAGDLNKESVAATGAQILIDTGEYKDGIEEDLDELQEQLGIPCVFIECKLDDWGSAYRKLGELLGEEERAEQLASYCERAYDEVFGVMSEIPESERARVLYCLGDTGTNVIANGSFQANVVDMVADNVAVVDSPVGSGAGNESNLEQIAVWDPEVILFGPDSICDTVADDPTWSTLTAIRSGSYYRIPGEPYNWLNNPPSVNQVLGMQWLARLLYPERFEGKESAYDAISEYYRLFYGYDLSEAEFTEITGMDA